MEKANTNTGLEKTPFILGLNKMYEYFEIAMFEVQLTGALREKIKDIVQALRNEK